MTSRIDVHLRNFMRTMWIELHEKHCQEFLADLKNIFVQKYHEIFKEKLNDSSNVFSPIRCSLGSNIRYVYHNSGMWHQLKSHANLETYCVNEIDVYVHMKHCIRMFFSDLSFTFYSYLSKKIYKKCIINNKERAHNKNDRFVFFLQVCFSLEKQKILWHLSFFFYIFKLFEIKHLSYFTNVVNVFVLIVDGLVHFFFFFFFFLAVRQNIIFWILY